MVVSEAALEVALGEDAELMHWVRGFNNLGRDLVAEAAACRAGILCHTIGTESNPDHLL